MKVAVLGCGPAGLLAAHAAVQCGHDVEIISKKVPSVITGAQYLHEPIPGITDEEPEGYLEYVKIGGRDGYAQKVYGDPNADVSWDKFPVGSQPAWMLISAYALLRQLYWDKVTDIWNVGGDGPMQGQLDPTDIGPLCDQYDVVLCTIPAQGLCHRHEHQFKGQQVVIMKTPVVYVQNMIVYNGRLQDQWYRTSNIFGYQSTEYSLADPSVRDHVGHLDFPGVWHGIKPIETDCDCHQEWTNFHRLGRFGQWKKSVLVSDAYKEALDLLTPTRMLVESDPDHPAVFGDPGEGMAP